MTRARDLASNSTGSKPTLIDAKADLIVGTGADAASRLAVGSNGDTIVADSAATTGLRWQPDFSVGRNKFINGDLAINQRAFTSVTATGTFTFDRWKTSLSGGTVTYTPQTFTLGSAPVAGYEGKNYLRIVTSGQSAAADFASIFQPIESVRNFAGQTVTVSFWAKAGSGTPNIAVDVVQNFGSGGSPSASVNNPTTKQAISTSWARYSFTVTLASISGKTLGTSGDDRLVPQIFVSAGSDRNAVTDSMGIQNGTFEFWGFQIEAGNVSTSFQTATGTLQGELAACQRYYQKVIVTNSLFTGQAHSTSTGAAMIPLLQQMRSAPTITIPAAGSSTGQMAFLTSSSSFPATIGTNTAGSITVHYFRIEASGYTSAFTAGNATQLYVTGTNQTFFEASSEL